MAASGADGTAAIARPVVGVDFGGTNIRAALADERGVLGERRKTGTPARDGVEAVVERVAWAVEGAAARTSRP